MKRRDFLVGSSLALGAAMVPSGVFATERSGELLLDRWSPSPWPGLLVRCTYPEGRHKGHNLGRMYYLVHQPERGSQVVRLCLGNELSRMIERGEEVPQISVAQCRPEYREKIREHMMEAFMKTCRVADLAFSPGPDQERMKTFPVLLRHPVRVQVVGSSETLERWSHEIPGSWERVVVPATWFIFEASAGYDHRVEVEQVKVHDRGGVRSGKVGRVWASKEPMSAEDLRGWTKELERGRGGRQTIVWEGLDRDVYAHRELDELQVRFLVKYPATVVTEARVLEVMVLFTGVELFEDRDRLEFVAHPEEFGGYGQIG